MAEERTGWHLDKKVPLGIIAALAVQTLTFTVMGSRWMAITDARLTHLEEAQTAAGGQDGRIIRLETYMDGIRVTLSSIERKVDELVRERRAASLGDPN